MNAQKFIDELATAGFAYTVYVNGKRSMGVWLRYIGREGAQRARLIHMYRTKQLHDIHWELFPSKSFDADSILHGFGIPALLRALERTKIRTSLYLGPDAAHYAYNNPAPSRKRRNLR